MERDTRRGTLRTGGGLLAACLAGCTGVGGSDDEGDDGSVMDTNTATTDGRTGTRKATETDVDPEAGTTSSDDGAETVSADDELDLREANVTAVAVERDGEGYRFEVTLYHDDGEEGYANWWQVETLDGERLGRRDLLHAHGTREFTRSATVTVPDDATCVVVRGHDETHGYGGQAMLVTLETAATRASGQGSEPSSFADADCP